MVTIMFLVSYFQTDLLTHICKKGGLLLLLLQEWQVT